MITNRLGAAQVYAARLSADDDKRRDVSGRYATATRPIQGRWVRADAVQVGMYLRGYSWWGANAGRWLRVNGVTHGCYQGMVHLACEGGQGAYLAPDKPVLIREEG